MSGTGSTVCIACDPGQVTGTLGATDSSACAAPPAVPAFDAALYNAAGSCPAALVLFNGIYGTNLTTNQQVSLIRYSFRLQAAVRPSSA